MLLLPLHIVTSFYGDEFLGLLVPTTIILAVGLEKLRLRDKTADDAGTVDAPDLDDVAPQLVADAEGGRRTANPQRRPGRSRAKRRR